MLKALAYSTVFSAALVGSGALAQSPSAADGPSAMHGKSVPIQLSQASKPDAQASKPDADQSQAAATSSQATSGAGNFVTTQDKAQWRAPKLVGVGVYGSDDKQIGKIDDILMSHDGKAETVVIGIGGFLGFGKKDVAVPFAALQWRTEPRKMPATDQPPANSTATTTGAGGQTAMKETDPAATEASQGYPDKAMLSVTLAELKSAPDFHYASSPLTEAESRPAAEPKKSGAP